MLGARIGGRYEVLRLIASGGMGEVFAARDHTLETDVALKTLKPELQSSTLAIERFRREIALARDVTDPHVCRVYDVGEYEGRVFFTMELLDGKSLADHELPLLPDAVERIAVQLVAGLAALHARGIVHRDVKTANVILVGERAVITDFGLARSLGDDAKLTIESGLLGTPAYMSPEQVEGRPATQASDIYSLGVVLFELLTGQLPFVADTAMAAATARLHRDAPRPSSVRSGIPARWDAIVARCLARDPAARFDRVEDLLASPPRSRRWFLAVGGVGVAAAAAGIWSLRSRSSTARPLRADQAIAVMPTAKKLGRTPRHLAFTVDLHDFLTSAGISAIDIYSANMDTSLFGPAMRWSKKDDPVAAAFAFSHISIVVLHAMVDDAVALTFVTRDGKRREERIVRRDGSTLAIEAAAAIARTIGFPTPRVADPPLSNAQYDAYGAALAALWRGGLTPEEKAAMNAKPFRRAQELVDLSDAIPQHARLAAHVADRIQADAEQQQTLDKTNALLAASRSYIDRALATDARCALAHAVRGHDAMLAWNWKLCDAATRRGHELAPTHGRTRYHRVFSLFVAGRFDELLPLVEYDWHVLMPHERLGEAPLGYYYHYARRYHDAVRVIAPKLRAFELDHWLEAVWAAMLVAAYGALARVDDAVAAANYLSQNRIDNYARAMLVGAYASVGRLDEAKRIYDEIRNAPDVDLGQLALMADSVGDYETALDAIEKTVESRNVHALFLKIAPFSAPLRAQPRFTALMKRMGFLG